MLVTDTSGSMFATDVRPSRLAAAQTAGRAMVDELPRGFRLGLVGFGTVAAQFVEPTTDKARVRAALDSLKFSGKTAMGDGLDLGIEAVRTPVTDETGTPRRIPGAIVLLSDGASTAGSDPITVAERARRLGVPIYTVALGTQAGYLEREGRDGTTTREPVPPDTATLREIARETRGRYYAAPDAQRLTEIFKSLGTRLATRQEKQEVTSAFAGGGLALLLVGMVAAMARGGRLP